MIKTNARNRSQPVRLYCGADTLGCDVSAEHMAWVFGCPLTPAEEPCKNSASRKRLLKTPSESEFARKALT